MGKLSDIGLQPADEREVVKTMRIRWILLAAAVVASGWPLAQAQKEADVAPYKNPKLAVEARVTDLLHRMTLEEKVAMLAGSGWMESMPIERLGIPAIKMADGPMGVRAWFGSSSVTNAATTPRITSTAFPAGLAMAATWDTDLLTQQGKAIGQEVKALGRDMILGPTVNIARQPLWGRNFEGYGEDPYLASRLVIGYIKGVQGEGVIATVKHFAANNQEFERHRIDEKIDERTLHEIYLPAFQAAVQEAGVWSVMSAYNKVNGLYCAENPALLHDVLKKQWGFKGFVISDWGSTYSTAGTVNAGMDLEMPGGQAMKDWLARPQTQTDGNGAGWLTPDKVQAAIAAGQISTATVDDNVSRILRIIFTAGLFDKPHPGGGAVDTPEQKALARTAAAESIVLLKNAGDLLPIGKSIRSLAVIGPNAAVARTGGGGSSLVRPAYAVTPLEGIRERSGNQVQVIYGQGASIPGEDVSKDSPSARAQLRHDAAALAAKTDAAIVVVGNAPSVESEGFDRKTLNLPEGQDELIQAVAKVNKNTIVVIDAGSPVAMDAWLDQVPAVLTMWYGGQEGGHAIASVLFGDFTPCGKLPVTFPRKIEDTPAYGHYPGENLDTEYAEGIYVGYRHYDRANIEPLFPFGHGLSYTKFDYSDLKVTPDKIGPGRRVQVSMTVRNSGSRAGAEVVQLYMHQAKSSVDRPPHELKAFRRVMLTAGQSETVTFTLGPQSMSFYSVAKHAWVAEPSPFDVLVGASSRDIRLKGSFELTAR
jgi:beta-glucosidase